VNSAEASLTHTPMLANKNAPNTIHKACIVLRRNRVSKRVNRHDVPTDDQGAL